MSKDMMPSQRMLDEVRAVACARNEEREREENLGFDCETPHAAIERVIEWLGIGFETTIKRRSDGERITIRISSEKVQCEHCEGRGYNPGPFGREYCRECERGRQMLDEF